MAFETNVTELAVPFFFFLFHPIIIIIIMVFSFCWSRDEENAQHAAL
jgi:hypothetical protein